MAWICLANQNTKFLAFGIGVVRLSKIIRLWLATMGTGQ